MYINSEWNTFAKFVRKESHDHHAEASFNEFCQFVNERCTVKNKEKHQSFDAQFLDRIPCRNNVVATSFRKALSSKHHKFSELVQDVCAEALDKNVVIFFAP